MILDVGPYKGTRWAKRSISPRFQNMRLRCGKCGGMDFEVHVAPHDDRAAVDELICLGCLTARNVVAGVVEAAGKTTKADIKDDYIAPKPSDLRALDVRKANDAG